MKYLPQDSVLKRKQKCTSSPGVFSAQVSSLTAKFTFQMNPMLFFKFLHQPQHSLSTTLIL